MLTYLRPREATERVSRAIGLAVAAVTSGTPSDQVIAEYLRETLMRLATDSGRRVAEPMHVLALLNQVRRQLRPLWPSLDDTPRRIACGQMSAVTAVHEGDRLPAAEEDFDPIRSVLDSLHELRDVAHVGGGYWLPTPTRMVALRAGDEARAAPVDALVVGGASTRALRLSWHHAVELRGISRVLGSGEIPPPVREDSTRWQRLEDWLGVPPVSLERWTADVLDRAAQRLAASSPDLVDFEVYSPEPTGTRLQILRWQPVRALLRVPDSLALCRSGGGRLSVGRRYWLGTVRAAPSGYGADREADLRPEDVRRLQYGLDLRAHAPTRARVSYETDWVTITLENALPGEERRLLLAFGTDVSAEPGRFPLRYQLTRDTAGVVLEMLSRLGVSLA